MKNIFTILTFILLVIACKKDNIVKEDKFPLFITAGQTDGAGIKYVVVDPDILADPGYISKNIDLNNDSINDFTLEYFNRHTLPSTFVNYLTITPLGENSVCVSKNSYKVQSLVYKDTIGSNNNWSNLEAELYSYSRSIYSSPDGTYIEDESFSGYWYDNDNIYLGVKIIKDGKELFGWMDVKMKGSAVSRYGITMPY